MQGWRNQRCSGNASAIGQKSSSALGRAIRLLHEDLYPIAWFVLHARWKNRNLAMGRAGTVGLSRLILGLLLTFPPIADLFWRPSFNLAQIGIGCGMAQYATHRHDLSLVVKGVGEDMMEHECRSANGRVSIGETKFCV
jgi:hypothetical protein